VRNLPAFPSLRKAFAVALLAAGGAGWAAFAWVAARPDPPAPEVDSGGAVHLGPLWEPGCPPVVASARGERYYWAWCEGAGQLAPKNLRRFCGPEAAEAAGLTLAKGCGGPPASSSEPPTEPPGS
jgi:DNA-binding transcriptional LysR family regulator